jgi:ACS family hexuronate transporter-like MFS transporter
MMCHDTDDEKDILATLQSQPNTSEAPRNKSGRGYFRWVICAVLFLGMTKNYVDRQVIGVLKTTLQNDLHWTEIDYGNLVFAFQAAYAAGLVIAGGLIDRLGTRVGYALAVTFWSLAGMAHGLAHSVTSFVVARGALGLSESAVFPASLKAVAEWFPKRERALATGIFNAGTNVGALVTPLAVPLITQRWGWRWAFLLLGALGFAWLALWLWIYRRPEEHPYCTAQELKLIRSDPPSAAAEFPWIRLLSCRQTWAFALGKFITDPVWWFYLFWVPDFLQRTHGLTLMQVGLPILVIYLIADAGSVAGGWVSSFSIKRGWSVNAARKAALLLCAVCALPIALAPNTTSTWRAVFLIGWAAAAHQGFSANLLTLPSDTFPQKAVASVVGFGGMAGAVSGMLVAKILSYHLQWTGSYKTPFLLAGSAYLLALAVIHVLAPRLEAAKLELTVRA